MTEQTTTPEKKVYQNSMGSCNYIFKNGDKAIFVRRDRAGAGTFITSNSDQIAELDAEIKRGHPNLAHGAPYSEDQDNPMAALLKQAREQVLAELAAAEAEKGTKDLGKSEQPKLSPQSTTDIQSVTMGGQSGAAKLVALAQQAGK